MICNPDATISALPDGSAKSSVVRDRDLEEKKSDDPSGPRIRCPLCGWSPLKEDKWFCACGHEWNTFETGGVCPARLQRWTETQCLSCARWSAHSEWYQTDGRCCRLSAKGNDYIGGIRSAHGWALSSCAAKRMSVASSPKREEKSTPMGRPSGVQCNGTDIEGCPDAL